MSNLNAQSDDRIISAEKLELTFEEAEFAEAQVLTAADPVPDLSSLTADVDQSAEADVVKTGPKARWPADDKNAPDYHHLSGSQISTDPSFEFTCDDIELVLRANRFEPHGKFKGANPSQDEVIAIAFRGLALGQSEEVGKKHEV